MKRIIATLGLGALVFVSAGCKQLKSRYEMNQGMQAYKNGQYPQALEHFTAAINLDPKNINGKLYRATAYMIQYVPGASTPQNKDFADKARNGFMDVLKDEPGNERAQDSLAYLCLQEANSMPNVTPQEQDERNKKLDEAQAWFQKVTKINHENRDAWYSLGVIDWMKWYTPLMNARSTVGMKPEDPGPLKDKDVRTQLREKYSAIINDGISNLETANKVNKDANYFDAMAYLNLLFRERADLAETPEQYQKDMNTAEDYFQQAKAKQQKLQKEQAAKGAAQ
jgi:tetratricopeptide (TPR) repeat protein